MCWFESIRWHLISNELTWGSLMIFHQSSQYWITFWIISLLSLSNSKFSWLVRILKFFTP